jgi:hypothetical protein
MAIMNLYISSYEGEIMTQNGLGDGYTVTRTNEEHAADIIDEINEANTYDEEDRKDFFEGYIGSYIKIA